MAVQIFKSLRNPNNAMYMDEIYQALLPLVPDFFGSVDLVEQSSSNAAYIVCGDKELMNVKPILTLTAHNTTGQSTETCLMGKNTVCHFNDNTTDTPFGSSDSSYIFGIGVCNNGVMIVKQGNSPCLIVSTDAYGKYAFAYCNMVSNAPNNPVGYAYDTNTAKRTYAVMQTQGEPQVALAHLLIPKLEHDYNYFPKAFYGTSKDSVVESLHHVTIQDEHYLTHGCAFYLKD